MSTQIDIGRYQESQQSESLQGRQPVVSDAVIEGKTENPEPEFWDIAEPMPVGRQKFFACRWRYINGQWICR